MTAAPLAATCAGRGGGHVDAELARVLNLSEGFASFATQYLLESGFIEAKDETGERFTLSPAYYRSVLRALRNKHLLFE